MGRESYSTETTQDAESPSWEENFEVSVTHPDEESVLFSVWDEDGDEEEEGDGAPLLLGVCSASLGGLELGDEKALCLPFRHGAREGVLNVILKALNYSTTDDDDDDGGENMGGGGEASEGALEERNALRAEVRELKNINKRLAAEVSFFWGGRVSPSPPSPPPPSSPLSPLTTIINTTTTHFPPSRSIAFQLRMRDIQD